MTDHLQRSSGRVPLGRCSVLYFGSAVPLETVAGLDSFKMPLRERYTLTDGHLLGIDATLTVYGAGMLVHYTADEASSAWFPIQALHLCAALKAFRTPTGGLDFAAVDTSLTRDSRHPPVFAFINRRTKGIRVLECHMFVCKSVVEATTLVQACMYTYEHKEGWLDEDPFKHASDLLPKIVPAGPASKYVESGFHTAEGISDASQVGLWKAEYARVPLQGFLHSNRQELIHKYNVLGYEDNGNQGNRTLQEPAVVIHQQPQFTGADGARTSSTFKSSPLVTGTGMTQAQYVMPEGYLAGVNPYGSVPFIFVPASSYYPGESRNMKQKKKQKTRNKSKESTKTDEENEDEIIEEYYYVRSANAPTYLSTTVQETRARDDDLRRGTMPPPHQTASIQNMSRYTAGEVNHQYITRLVPNIHVSRIEEGRLMQQRYLQGSVQHNVSRSGSQNAAVEPARKIESANDQSTGILLVEPIPDYPTEPTELYAHTRRYDTGFPRTSQEIHREARYGHHNSRVTGKLESPRDGRREKDKFRVPSTAEPEDKRGYAELIGDLGYLP